VTLEADAARAESRLAARCVLQIDPITTMAVDELVRHLTPGARRAYRARPDTATTPSAASMADVVRHGRHIRWLSGARIRYPSARASSRTLSGVFCSHPY